MVVARVSLASQVLRKVIGVVIAVIGLLIVRGIVGALPMLKNAPSIGNSGVTPLMIAQAILSTLIFIALLRFGAGMSAVLRAGYLAFPESGAILNLAVIAAVVAWAYGSYSNLSRRLLDESYEYYGWIFLLLVLAPIVGIVVLTARNIDTITDLFLRSSRAPAAKAAEASVQRCPRCGDTVPEGKKFCAQCGLAVSTPLEPTPVTSSRCPSCGAENAAKAKFCEECGKPLAAAGTGA